jgi:phosphatidylglycerol---prolipoprotein diacylglyceryl transferase
VILLPLLSIPSPSDPLIFEIGIIKLRWYGTLIAIGILIAGWLASRELDRRGFPPGRAYTIATWCIPGGVIGARLYHVATDWDRFSGHLDKIPMLQEGGLGMPGVIVGGAIGAAIGARRAKVPVLEAFDVVAPGLILAQAIGRWGNWFNQELFGGPTDLPWGLEIDPAHRPVEYANQPTFHPTFLYESLWNLLVFVILMQLNKRLWLRAPAGTIFAAYLMLYSIGRVFTESLRIDPAQLIFGVRFNLLLFICVAIGGGIWFFVNLSRARPAN